MELSLVKTRKLAFSLGAFLVFLIGLSFSETSAVSPDAAREEIREIETRLSREVEELEALGSMEEQLLEDLYQLEEEVEALKGTVAAVEENLKEAQNEIERLEGELDEAEGSLEAAKTRMVERLVALYKHARQGYVKLLADAEGFPQLWKRVKYLRVITKKDREVLENLSQDMDTHRSRIEDIKEDIAEYEELKRTKEEELSSLVDSRRRKLSSLILLRKRKENQKKVVEEIRGILAELNKEKRTWSSRFQDLKGNLPLPIKGEVVKGDQYGDTGKGVYIKGNSDLSVRAVFPGRIEYSGDIKGYGGIIIINHGSRFRTVSGRLSLRKGREGDFVEAGEVVGMVDRGGDSTGAGLYFEIRKGDENLDPLEWLEM